MWCITTLDANKKKENNLVFFFIFFIFIFICGLLSCHWMKEWEYGKIRDDKIG